MSLNYIHADHLGRPAFVTDPSGAVIWDAGITTPFGQSYEAQDIGDTVQTMAALTTNLAQPLMFPGQYRDIETGYDDNWHRTYDPALGRYLQSDPIGLGGGLNRYAYVGGNPVNYVDPTGELFWFAPIVIGMAAGAAFDIGFQLVSNGGRIDCLDWSEVALSAGMGAIPGGAFMGAFKHSVSGLSWLKASRRFSNVSPRIHTARGTKGLPIDNHHWAIPHRGWGRHIPDFIKNHPWNIQSLPRASHQFLHSNASNIFQRWNLGVPAWAKGAQAGFAAGLVLPDMSDTCGC